MTNKTRTRTAFLLRKSVGLPGREGTCCGTIDRDAGAPEPTVNSDGLGGCCGTPRGTDASRTTNRAAVSGGGNE